MCVYIYIYKKENANKPILVKVQKEKIKKEKKLLEKTQKKKKNQTVLIKLKK